MKVLLTGAFGNLGLMCLEQALELGHQVRCFDIDTDKNRQLAARYETVAEVVLGDIRDSSLLPTLLQDIDGIIHNASLLPPLTDNQPELAEAVNVQACKALIDVAQRQPQPPVFIFPSSVTVFGLPEETSGSGRVLTAQDAVMASDNYTRHKLAIEAYLRASQLPWVVLRVGVSVDARTLSTDWQTLRKLLAVRADNPLEYVHPKDVAGAMCRALQSPLAHHKVLLIGGGRQCQINQRQFLQAAFSAAGLQLPEAVHGDDRFYTHWMDTSESQAILDFQQHNFAGYQAEMANKLRWVRRLLWPLRWLINPLLSHLLVRLVRG